MEFSPVKAVKGFSKEQCRTRSPLSVIDRESVR